jgi:hypothetical protein
MAKISAKVKKGLAGTVIAVAFGIYVNQGHLNWIPSWVLVGVCVLAGIYWISLLGKVREVGKKVWQKSLRDFDANETHAMWIALGNSVAILLLSLGVGLFLWGFRPNMRAEIAGCGTGELEIIKPAASIWLNVDVTNIGPPSTTSGWRLTVKLRNGETFDGKELRTWISVSPYGEDHKAVIEIPPERYIQSRTETTPIPTGGKVRGMLAFIFPGLPRERVNDQETRLILNFSDAAQHEYETKYEIPTKVDYLVTHQQSQ